MMEADLDRNGTIEFPEFLNLMRANYGRDDQEADLRWGAYKGLYKGSYKGAYKGSHAQFSGRLLRCLTATKMASLTLMSLKR